MSVPRDLMKLMGGAAGGGAPGGAEPGAGPSGGAMTTPQPKAGQEQAAMVNISLVFQLLEQSLGMFGSQSDKGKAVLNALKTLTGEFGKDRQKADTLIPAELMQLVNSIPGMGGGSPAQKTMGAMPGTQPAVPQGA